jgi:hypothetical protein
VEDYESIAAGVLPGQQVVILDSTKNGIEQITYELEKYASTNGAIDSVHIISHGNSGSLQLGNTALDSDNIEQNKSQLEKWHNSLALGAVRVRCSRRYRCSFRRSIQSINRG